MCRNAFLAKLLSPLLTYYRRGEFIMTNTKEIIINQKHSYILNEDNKPDVIKMSNSKSKSKQIVIREFLNMYNCEELLGRIINSHLKEKRIKITKK